MNATSPTSWRDVYQLVGDSEKRVLLAIAEVKRVGDANTSRIDNLEDLAEKIDARAAGRRDVFIWTRIAMTAAVSALTSGITILLTLGLIRPV